MRELSFLYLEKPINLDEIDILTLIIENKKQLFNIEKYIRFEFSGQERYFSYFINKKSLDIDEYIGVIDDLFILDVNTKKNINSLYKILSAMYGYKIEDDISFIKNKIKQIVKEISLECNLDLIAIETLKDDDVFRLVDLKINDDIEDPVKRLLNYINVIYELRKIDIFMVFRLHEYFEHEELETIIKELSYKNIKLIDIECANNFQKCKNEKVVIYDNDLSTIV